MIRTIKGHRTPMDVGRDSIGGEIIYPNGTQQTHISKHDLIERKRQELRRAHDIRHDKHRKY